ncbi:MAG TPA: histidine phosphatase family protein [Dongiaceae bacterium]|nr:histidine phosphatase family protein [Dongiaceae bacterium]
MPAASAVYKWPARLVVMRHAESEANYHRQYLEKIDSPLTHLQLNDRDVDVPLTAFGKRQADEVGQALAKGHPPFDVAYVSPYRRTRETAAIACARLEPSPVEVMEERLREREFGILEGLTKKGLRAIHPQEHERRLKVGKYYYRPPGGESYPDVNLRVHSFLGTLVREHAGQRVLVVTHSVVVLSFRRLIERLEEDKVLELDRHDEPKNAALSVYESQPGTAGGRGLALLEWNLTHWSAHPKEALS